MSFGYSRTVLRKPRRNDGTIGRERFHIERAYSALVNARLHVMLAERADPGCTDAAIGNILLAMDYLKPGAIAQLMPLHEDER